MKGRVDIMEKNNTNNVWKIVLTVVAILTALAVALAVLIRTERRLRRLVGIVDSYLPHKHKNTPIEVEL